MGQVLHASATTTAAVRRAIQARHESVRALAKRYGIGPTTVQRWRERQTVADEPIGPKQPRSTVLSVEVEAVIVAFRGHNFGVVRALGSPSSSASSTSVHHATAAKPWCIRRKVSAVRVAGSCDRARRAACVNRRWALGRPFKADLSFQAAGRRSAKCRWTSHARAPGRIGTAALVHLR